MRTKLKKKEMKKVRKKVGLKCVSKLRNKERKN